MSPELLLYIILGIVIVSTFFDFIVETLNISHITPTVPKAFGKLYDKVRYQKSQDYLKENTHLSMFQTLYNTVISISFILLGGFNSLDHLVRMTEAGPLLRGLYFILILTIATQIINLPFKLKVTFGIEKKYEFNTITPKLFITDMLKGLVLSILIGGPILALVLSFFSVAGPSAWLYIWGVLSLIQGLLLFIAPVLLMPLFNTFEPLEDRELKTAILNYCDKENFTLKGLFKMDGSKRSKKSNAFFTGFGKFRRIVLFDTLIEKHSVEELVGIVAHEMGHYKKKHILKMIITSTLSSGLMLFLLSKTLLNPLLFAAFKMDYVSIYASLVFFGFLYSPVEEILGIFSNISSRKHEFEADAYAVSTTGNKAAMITALKKLSVDNLSNLCPHPLKVWLSYSHPPVLQRIKSIEAYDVD